MTFKGLAEYDTLLKQVFEYILPTYPEADMEALRAAGFDEIEGVVDTIAEVLMEQGKAEGLTRLPERRSGPLPPTIGDRISAADPGELDAWLRRLLDAVSLDAVFNGINCRWIRESRTASGS